MFNNNRGTNNIFGAAGGQTNNAFPNNNIFGGNTGQTQNNIFNANAQTQNNQFNRGNNPTPQGNNLFNQNQGNTGSNVFNNQGPGNTFNTGANNQTNNIFGQNTQQNNSLLNQQRPVQGNNIFGQNTQQGFNQGNQQAGNIFGQNTQSGNQQGAFFNQNTQQGNFFGQNTQQTMVGAGNPQNPILTSSLGGFNLLQFSPEQQASLVKQLTNKQVKEYIESCFKNLVEPKRLENMTLGNDNNLRNEKVNAFAAKHNIKTQLLQVKKQVRDKLTNPIKELKQKDQALTNASSELAFKVTEKLQKYKESLIEAISENKMIEDIKREITDIDNQIKDFLKPLFNSHQTRNSYSFIDPDQFCIKISEQILKNISYLDNKMDELLACEGEVSQEATDTGEIIERLVEYYENVVISLREFSEKYQKQKKDVLSKRKVGSSEDILRKIMEKANMSVRKELKAYELVKEIEQILLKREKKNADMMME